MNMIIKKNNQTPVQPEGHTTGAFIKASFVENVRTARGIRNEVHFTFESAEGYHVKHKMSAAYYLQTELARFVKEVSGQEPEEISLGDLLNIECECDVTHYIAPNGFKIAYLSNVRRIEPSAINVAQDAEQAFCD